VPTGADFFLRQVSPEPLTSCAALFEGADLPGRSGEALPFASRPSVLRDLRVLLVEHHRRAGLEVCPNLNRSSSGANVRARRNRLLRARLFFGGGAGFQAYPSGADIFWAVAGTASFVRDSFSELIR
jgi:hypothetical protein